MVSVFRQLAALLFLVSVGQQTVQALENDYLSIDRYAPKLTGKYLVASPELRDPNFYHTVIYMVHHDSQGAMGVVINRLMAKGPIGKLLEGFGLDSQRSSETQLSMHYGGPVEPGSSLMIHRKDYRNDSTINIGGRLAMSSADDVLNDIARGRGPADRLLVLGYAGWGAAQLEKEITSGTWHVIDADETLLFDDDITTKWQRALALRGFEL